MQQIELKTIKIDKIILNPFNPKKDFKDYELTGFDLSLKQWGVIRHMIVCNSPYAADEFIVIDGNSLYKKIKSAGALTADVLVVKKEIETESQLKRLTLDYNLALKNIDTTKLFELFFDVKDLETLEQSYQDIFANAHKIDDAVQEIEKDIADEIYPLTEILRFDNEQTHNYFKRFICKTKKITQKSKFINFLNDVTDQEITNNLAVLVNAIHMERKSDN
jgi:ParB-like chromosome segregation protein Spo0J